SEHPEVVLFELVFVDARRWIDGNSGKGEDLRLVRICPDLKVIHVRTRDQAEPCGGTQKIRKITESLALIRLVVNRRRARRGRLDTAGGAKILAAYEVAHLAD